MTFKDVVFDDHSVELAHGHPAHKAIDFKAVFALKGLDIRLGLIAKDSICVTLRKGLGKGKPEIEQ